MAVCLENSLKVAAWAILESIMLESQFAPLFSRHDLDFAAWNLKEVDAAYRPPTGSNWQKRGMVVPEA